MPNLQPTDITNNGGFYPRVIEDALDRHVAQIQQIDEKVDRALKVAVTSPLGDQALPSPVAGMLIGWNESNDGLKNYAPIGGTLLGQQLAAAEGSTLVGFQQSGASVVARTAQDKMREVVTDADFGAALSVVLKARAALGAYGVHVGVGAGEKATGLYNTTVGHNAGSNITTGEKNVFLGTNGGSGNAVLVPVVPLTGTDNIGIGFHAIKKCQSGVMNIGVGTDAGNEITTGSGNTCLGGSAGQQITIGDDNTLVGRSAGLRLGTNSNAGGTPSDPTTWQAIGGTGNAALGRDSLRNAYNCNNNTALGYQAMRGTKDETDLTGNITGSNNIAIGYRALYSNPTSAAGNVIVGTQAGQSLSAGSNNVVLGMEAGRDFEGSGNIIIGRSAYRSVTTADNKFVVANQSGTAFLDGDMVGAGNGGNLLKVDASFRPSGDNTRALGSAAGRWSVVYAGSGTINTSDEREKQDIGTIPDAVLDAWAQVQWQAYRFVDSVSQKGDSARWHTGLVAQRVLAAFSAHGLDAREWGVLCYDEWGDEFEPVVEMREVASLDDKGIPTTEMREIETGEVRLVRPAGNRYGIRYEEAFALESALMRRELSRAKGL